MACPIRCDIDGNPVFKRKSFSQMTRLNDYNYYNEIYRLFISFSAMFHR